MSMMSAIDASMRELGDAERYAGYVAEAAAADAEISAIQSVPASQDDAVYAWELAELRHWRRVRRLAQVAADRLLNVHAGRVARAEVGAL